MGANSIVMAEETRLETRLRRWVTHAGSPRGATAVIASVTTLMTIAAGLLMSIIDHAGFPSLGTGLWWAVQTVTTVGYGDHVPVTVAGRLVAALVMLLGLGFITVITAYITSSFVTRSRRDESPTGNDAEQLRKIDERLERIEAALNERS